MSASPVTYSAVVESEWSSGDVKATVGVYGPIMVDAFFDRHAIFLMETPSVSTETWDGLRAPQRNWQTGGVAFLPAGSVVRCCSATDVREIVIQLDDRYFRDVAASITGDAYRTAIAPGPMENATVSAAAALAKAVSMQANCPASAMLLDSAALSLAASVFAARGSIVEPAHGLGDTRIRRVIEFVEANLHRHITLAELAAVAALSHYHFSRSFKLSLGQSPSRYILLRRIDRARRLLSTPIPLSDVCHQAGFASQSHFCDAFKREVGRTPSEYRLEASR